MAVDSTSLYWIEKDQIVKMPLSSGTPVVIAAPAGYIPGQSHLALDATSVYWTGSSGVLEAAK